MKIVHTGDWHIGKIVNEYSMIEEQKYYLDKLVELLREKEAEALIISGDIYDRSVPPAEAVELLDTILSKIILELKIPVLAIGGNHDSAERLSFGNKLLRDKGLYIEGNFNGEVKKVTLKDNDGSVNFYLLPYIDPAQARILYENPEIKTHDDMMREIVSRIYENLDIDERNILIAHGYVSYSYEDKEHRGGLEVCDSERPLSIGGTDIVDGSIFEKFDYVALGHIHGPQKVGSNKIRYSGSLLKYSISEWKQKKSIPVIDINKDKNLKVELIEIKPLRDLRVIRGPIDELLNRENHQGTNLNDYVFAEITDEGEILDAISKLRAVFPNIMGLRMVNTSLGIENSKTSAGDNFREKSLDELFGEFYIDLKGKEMDEARNSEVIKILEELERGK
ncbi:exonuclease SbcCD subunit D [Clostridium sp.]|uniref:exonuclease SbcCD subunit D n=1 Tax=Clostridium sp. TaxID=1506 RepID=UPI002E75F3CE|nr:exonuclease SbcCD subunit D [Clostridium sp.]MEE0567844.1 exonuclease SbcCD subunit D [Clostridium sp.]